MITLKNISKHGVEEIKLIQEEAKKYPQIEKIYLFGSCAKETDTKDSDIDTLIIWNGLDSENFGLISFEFVKDVFTKKMFKWDRLFESSLDDFYNKDYGVYLNIKELNNIIYERTM